MSYWSFVSKAIDGATNASLSLGQSIASAVQARRVGPSRTSIRRGILVPGDGPPTTSASSFRDYREVLLPEQLAPLRQGIFPLGRAQHPGKDTPDFPIYLDWAYIARHIALVGPPGSGKTFSILAPWIVAACIQGLTTVAVDVKGDLQAEIHDARVRMGVSKPIPTGVWDISNPRSSRPWSPLAEITSPEHAAQVAMAFLGEIDPMDHQKFFAERDHRWLRGLLWLTVQALGNKVHPSVVYKAIVSPQLLASLVQQAPHAAHEVVDLVQHSPADYAKVTAGLANRLSWLADPALATMLDGQHPNAFTLDDALTSGVLLIVGARESGGERSAAAAAILLNLLRLKCLGRFGHNPMPVFWMLDEARSYAHRIQLAQMLDLLRGAHSPVCIGLQDVNQLGSTERQTRMLTNCDTFITLAGVSSDTARYFSNRLGTVKAPAAAMAYDQSGAWRPTISHQDRPLLGDREIMYPAITGQYGGIAQLRSGSPYPFLFSLS